MRALLPEEAHKEPGETLDLNVLNSSERRFADVDPLIEREDRVLTGARGYRDQHAVKEIRRP